MKLNLYDWLRIWKLHIVQALWKNWTFRCVEEIIKTSSTAWNRTRDYFLPSFYDLYIYPFFQATCPLFGRHSEVSSTVGNWTEVSSTPTSQTSKPQIFPPSCVLYTLSIYVYFLCMKQCIKSKHFHCTIFLKHSIEIIYLNVISSDSLFKKKKTKEKLSMGCKKRKGKAHSRLKLLPSYHKRKKGKK